MYICTLATLNLLFCGLRNHIPQYIPETSQVKPIRSPKPDLNGRVAARIKDLARPNVQDRAASENLGLQAEKMGYPTWVYIYIIICIYT